jgi:hypothetical protein
MLIAREYLGVTLTWIHQVAKKKKTQIDKIFAETYKNMIRVILLLLTMRA